MTLQLQFDHSKKFQLDAIESTVKLFEGQQKFNESFVDFVDGVVPNKLTISESTILENLKEIQKQNQIPISEKLDEMNFSIEMETGTGKTYVYLRTIYELNQNYGFKKFVIVVPSVAIKEGTKKNFDITKNDFQVLYDKTPIESTEYSSKNISYIRQFSNSNKIEVMIITRDSFNKDANIMNIPQDKFYGKRPIELVKKTNPILILDEPQNMESEITKEAIANLNPLFTLRYSATHKNPYNLIYRLSPVDAYEQKLVKKIEVTSITEDNNQNSANIECHAITAGKKIQAKLKVIKQQNDKIKPSLITVKHGDNLKEKTNSSQYDGYVISEINAARNFIKFSNGKSIKLGEKQGSNNEEIQRIQIRETIKNHLYRQEQLKDDNIKVLSLFFIDKVDNYLNGGILQKIFDEEFDKFKHENPDFKDLEPEKVRNGYFSKMKTNKSIENDSEAFNLIMKEKEKLLSFSEPTCFIFSHSALREGWDNPNVFNICTLNQSVSNLKKRQEIGRGLRIPVDQNGAQKLDKQYELTVIANESYEDYVKKLQEEYVDDYGYSGASPPTENSKKRVYIKLDKKKLDSKEFQELWGKISQKTSYFTTLDSDKLVQSCIKIINENIKISSLKIKVDTVSVDMQEDKNFMSLTWKKIGESEEKMDQTFQIGNVVDELSEKTNLTRRSIIKILTGINNLKLLFVNPQEFLLSVTNIIKNTLDEFVIDGIQYKPINEKYSQFKFDDIEIGYDHNTIDTSRSIYDKIRYDSEFEKEVSQYLNSKDERVKLYLKMPNWFKIDTPIGNYNTDWGIVTEKRNPQGKYEKTLYFMAETKAKKDTDLGLYERLKIKCGQRHFQVLGIPFEVVKTISDLEHQEFTKNG
ncbi:MAG: DEAD/DEAH box helicase family protein [Candidatus Nitrosopelagicus sp.]|nr:DEAD/DEAH box helicase family protein [Candidatus Nitrosopelagicus sp.]